jgi:hypothetical protein
MARFVLPAGAAALALACVATLGVTGAAQRAASQPSRLAPPLVSPDGKVKLAISVNASGQWTWSASLEDTPVIDPSPLGIVVGGTNFGAGAQIVRAVPYRVDERYDWLGVHSRAVNSANGARISVTHASGRNFVVDARAADDYVAFRIIVNGTGRHVPDAGVAFTIPQGATMYDAARPFRSPCGLRMASSPGLHGDEAEGSLITSTSSERLRDSGSRGRAAAAPSGSGTL